MSPVYPGAPGSFKIATYNNSPIALQKGEHQYVWGLPDSTETQLPIRDNHLALETILAGQASIAVNLQAQAGDPPPMVCVEIRFSAAPGVFEIDIQEADTDADGFFITPSNSAYTVNAVNAVTFVVRVDLSPTGGKFLRLYMKALANAVNVSAKITRLA